MAEIPTPDCQKPPSNGPSLPPIYTYLFYLSAFLSFLFKQYNIYSPNHNALLLVQEVLGIRCEVNALENQCNSIGITSKCRLKQFK